MQYINITDDLGIKVCYTGRFWPSTVESIALNSFIYSCKSSWINRVAFLHKPTSQEIWHCSQEDLHLSLSHPGKHIPKEKKRKEETGQPF